MKNFFKGKFGTAVILVFTLILAGVAVFTALRLYQLRSQPVAPNVPSSIPKAAENTCSLSFTISTSTSTPTPTPTGTGLPTATPTVTPTPTATSTGAPNSCNGTCGSNTNCGTGLYCNTSVGFCRNPSCPNQADCNCPGSTTTPTPTGVTHVNPTPTPTAPALPNSGTDWPTVVGAGIGIFVVAGSLLLAL